MEDLRLIKKEINEFGSLLPKITFEKQYELNRLVSNLSNLLSDINFNILKDVRDSFGKCNDAVQEIVEAISASEKVFEQSIFMAGQLSMMFKITNDVCKNITEQISSSADINDKFLKGVIFELNSDKVLSHGKLASRLGMEPAALTMRIKRNASWKKYITSYINPEKQNSTLYVLNGSGNAMFERMNNFIEHDCDIDRFSRISYLKDFETEESYYGFEGNPYLFGKRR